MPESPGGLGGEQGGTYVTRCRGHCPWGSRGPHSLARKPKLVLGEMVSPPWPLEAPWTPLPAPDVSAPSRVSRSALQSHCPHAGFALQMELSRTGVTLGAQSSSQGQATEASRPGRLGCSGKESSLRAERRVSRLEWEAGGKLRPGFALGETGPGSPPPPTQHVQDTAASP